MPDVTHDTFPGFPSSLEKAYWQFPSIINGYVHSLTGTEFKVLWYILRHTFGWQKNSDKLSLSQICNGIKKRNGEIIDLGTGISRRSATRVLDSLREKGFIKITRTKGKPNDISPNITNYSQNCYTTIAKIAIQREPENYAQNEANSTIAKITTTINNTIDNTNKYSDTKGRCPLGDNEKHKEKCIDLIDRVAEEKKIPTFPNYPKQVNAIHKSLRAGFTLEDIEDMAAKLSKDSFWQEQGWDMMTVANQLGKRSYGS